MYRDDIFCIESATYKSVGDWLKETMKKAGIKRWQLLSEIQKCGYKGATGAFISGITSGRECIPKKYIPIFCENIGLSKPMARYYTAEILRLSLPEEFDGYIIKTMKSACQEAREINVGKGIEKIEEQRTKQINTLNSIDDIFGSPRGNHDKTNQEYDLFVEQARKRFSKERPTIRTFHYNSEYLEHEWYSGGQRVSIEGAAYGATYGDPLALQVFFDNDLEPVSDMVSMARLYRFFKAHKTDDHGTFREVVEAICSYGVLGSNINPEASSWHLFLFEFLDRTHQLNQKKIDQILSSASEIEQPLEAAKQVLNRINPEYYDEDVFRSYFAEIEFLEDPNYPGRKSTRGKTPISEFYISGILKKCLQEKKP